MRYWQIAGEQKYIFEICQCFLNLGQIANAHNLFCKAIQKYPEDKRCVELASILSGKIDKVQTIMLWKNLQRLGVKGQDTVLWNLAIRSNTSQAINYYDQFS